MSTGQDETAQWVAQELAAGKTWQAVATELVGGGWERGQAKEYVQAIQSQLGEAPPMPMQHDQAGGHEEGSGGDGVPSWLFYVGGLILFNALSWFFGWGWIIY